ncbi:MAG: hypothetical protein K8R85_14725 [Bacteroidetes bacterium]|nr:hypothetical protein [Bacteroidota bacterium]
MKLFVFYCSSDSSLYGITNEISGNNLPNEDCKTWMSWKEIEIEENSVQLIGANPQEILKALNERGYWTGAILVQFNEWKLK